jgi:AcrR family transcriptional regulator
MRKVARMVGLSAPALYRHFRNKEELLDEIVSAGLRILEDYLGPALEADEPYERLVRLTENYLSFALEQPEYFDVAFLTPAPKVTGFQEEIDKPDWATFRLAVEQVSACMEQGVFQPDDPLATALTIWAEVHGLVTLFRTGRFAMDPTQFRQVYRTSVDRMLKGLMAPSTPRPSVERGD